MKTNTAFILWILCMIPLLIIMIILLPFYIGRLDKWKKTIKRFASGG